MQLSGQQKYSFGTVQFELNLEGGYDGLPAEVLDKLSAAAQTGIAQLPMWIEGSSDQQPKYVGNNERFSAEETDDDGAMRCTLMFQGVAGNTVPHRIAGSIPRAIIRSCITEALVHSVGAQALNDPYARTHGSQLSTRASEETDGTRSSRTKQLR